MAGPPARSSPPWNHGPDPARQLAPSANFSRARFAGNVHIRETFAARIAIRFALISDATHSPRSDRRRDSDHLFRLRSRDRLCLKAPHAHKHGFFSFRTLDSRLGRRPGISLGQSRRAGSHRHGCLGREIRHHDEPFLLGGRDSRDGLRRRLHDAVLLRVEGALRAGVFEAAFRRKDPRAQRQSLSRP